MEHIQDLRRSIIESGVKGIKVPGINGGPTTVTAEDADIIIDMVNREVWYRLHKERMVIPLYDGWTMVPFENVFGIAFNDKTPNHEHHHAPDHRTHQESL